jgi:DNA-binding winged helix-turn-helix (wHTH) protein
MFPKCFRHADFCYFCSINEAEMKKNRSIITLLAMLILTALVVLLSCRYATQVKNGQILKAVYLFSQAVDNEKELMRPALIVVSESETEKQSDSTVIETEKGKTIYKRSKETDTLTSFQKREWNFQMYLAFKNSNRAFTLDSLFQEGLKSEGIVAQTAVSFFQGDSLVSCSNKSLCQAGIALDPVVFGVEHDPKQIKLQAYVSFSRSYLISQMPLIWGLIILWIVPGILMYIWLRRKKVEYKEVINPVPPISALISLDASEWKEITPGIFFNEKTGVLKTQDHEVCLKRNRLRAFSRFLGASDHTISYSDFCKNVLERPLNEDESNEKNKELNQAIKKSMTQTIQRLRDDLKDFPVLSIDNIPNSGYQLNIETVLSESDMHSISGGCCSKLLFDENEGYSIALSNSSVCKE